MNIYIALSAFEQTTFNGFLQAVQMSVNVLQERTAEQLSLLANCVTYLAN